MPNNNRNRVQNRQHPPRQGNNIRPQDQAQPQTPAPTAFPQDKLPSPYNFCPLPKNLFFPDGEKDGASISMDKPFSDGISGRIKVKVTAKSEIYIRNGGIHPKEIQQRNQSPQFQDFFRIYPDDPKAPYAIPGSSIKGSIRNVLETASFSALRCMDRPYSIRDLTRGNKYTPWMTTRQNGDFLSKVQAGFLYQIHGKYVILPCEYVKVEQRELNNLLGVRLRGTTREKYDSLSSAGFRNPIKIYFQKESNQRHQRHRNVVYNKGTALSLNSTDDSKNGILVCTGQAGSKHMEFLFHGVRPKEAKTVPERIFRDFELIHSTDRPQSGDGSTEKNTMGEPNEEWSYWRNELKNGKMIPVFYLAHQLQDGSRPNNQTPSVSLSEPGAMLHSFGLAMMYRLPGPYTTHDIRDRSAATDYGRKQNEGICDLAETLFGFVESDGHESSLRGRINFEPLVAEEKPEHMPTGKLVPAVLSSPKPPYSMTYLEQSQGNQQNGHVSPDNISTIMDSGALLRGWKRYPARKDSSSGTTGNPEMQTFFRPLKNGSSFTGDIFFHNLRPFELGALVWALTFGCGCEGSQASSYCHSLGMAKPLGYGAVHLEIKPNASTIQPNQDAALDDQGRFLDECMNAYVLRMEKELDGKWLNSETIGELKAMADIDKAADPSLLDYPTLGLDRNGNAGGRNDFAGAKGRDQEYGRFLLRHSKLV